MHDHFRDCLILEQEIAGEMIAVAPDLTDFSKATAAGGMGRADVALAAQTGAAVIAAGRRR